MRKIRLYKPSNANHRRNKKFDSVKFTFVSNKDYRDLSKFRWHYSSVGVYRQDEKLGVVLMHRQIFGFPECRDIDHRDGNRLLNTRKNLRVSTHRQNSRNRRK